jgi:glutathione S-transferase
MKLVYAPGACSIGIHVVLEEIGKPYEAQRVDLMKGEQYGLEFVAISAKSKVPVLVRDDGSVLTEFPAIAWFLARSNPAAGLLPENIETQARTLEAMDYCVATVHMQGFQRVFRAKNFTANEADLDAVRTRGREIIDKGFALLDATLAGRDWIAGSYSIADAALFYVTFWAVARMKWDVPANLAAHYARMTARPAVARTLAAEGFA